TARRRTTAMTDGRPCDTSRAPCSRSSRPLRAASGGGLRPALTSAARGAPSSRGRDEETASCGRTKKLTVDNQPGLECRPSARLHLRKSERLRVVASQCPGPPPPPPPPPAGRGGGGRGPPPPRPPPTPNSCAPPRSAPHRDTSP